MNDDPRGDPGTTGGVGATGAKGGGGGTGGTGGRGGIGLQGQRGRTGATGEQGPRGKTSVILIYVIAALAAILAVASWVQIERTEDFSETLSEASVNACERQNEVRRAVNLDGEIVAEGLRSDIAIRKAFIAESTPGQVVALKESIARDRVNLKRVKYLNLTDCEAAFP